MAVIMRAQVYLLLIAFVEFSEADEKPNVDLNASHADMMNKVGYTSILMLFSFVLTYVAVEMRIVFGIDRATQDSKASSLNDEIAALTEKVEKTQLAVDAEKEKLQKNLDSVQDVAKTETAAIQKQQDEVEKEEKLRLEQTILQQQREQTEFMKDIRRKVQKPSEPNKAFSKP